jgi:hypothetical protein
MAKSQSMFQAAIVRRASLDALIKLDPRTMAKNPVMFVVEVGSVLTTALLISGVVHHAASFGFNLQTPCAAPRQKPRRAGSRKTARSRRSRARCSGSMTWSSSPRAA